VSASWGGGDDGGHRLHRSTPLRCPDGYRKHIGDDDLAVTFVSLARLAHDLADQTGLLGVMVAQVGDAPPEEARAATLRATADLHAAAGALSVAAGRVRL
jgi:hypothetical protein